MVRQETRHDDRHLLPFFPHGWGFLWLCWALLGNPAFLPIWRPFIPSTDPSCQEWWHSHKFGDWGMDISGRLHHSGFPTQLQHDQVMKQKQVSSSGLSTFFTAWSWAVRWLKRGWPELNQCLFPCAQEASRGLQNVPPPYGTVWQAIRTSQCCWGHRPSISLQVIILD